MRSIKADKISSKIKLEKDDMIVEEVGNFNLEDEEGNSHNIKVYKEKKDKLKSMQRLSIFDRRDNNGSNNNKE